MRYIVLCLIALATITINGKNFNMAVDGAVFRYDDYFVKYELYYSFPDNAFSYTTEKAGLISKTEIRLILKSNIKTQIDTTWQITNFVESTSDIGKKDIFGTKAIIIPSGEYSVNLIITNLNDTTEVQKIDFKLLANNINNDNISLSEIQLSYLIESASNKTFNWDEQFQKNSMYILPNPSTEIAGSEPAIISYFEIYNAKKYSPDGITLNYILKDATRKEVLFFSRDKITDSDLLIETIKLPVDVIPTGIYYLNVSILFPRDNPTDSVLISKRLYIINKNVPLKQLAVFAEDEMFEKSEFASMIDNRIELEVRMAKKIATNEEIASAERISTVKAKQRFLYKFWNARDIDTIPGINERLEKFRKAAEFANLHFMQGGKEGWDTERGEIMLKYGIPETRNVYEAVGDLKAYEEWHYNTIEGGTFFYFVDISAHNGYILVHSTHPKQIYNPNWYNQYVDKNSETKNKNNQNSNFNTNPR